jgi:flagellar hook-associated protein 3 FlgL
MRVTANTFPNTLASQLAELTSRQARLQAQAASGQRITTPSDDPTAMRRVLDLQNEARSSSQYQENIARLQENTQATFEVLRNLKSVSDRAGEIAILADGTKSPDELELYAIEITGLIKHAAQLANTNFRDSYLLAGTQSDQPPFVVAADAEGRVTSVGYQGNETVSEIEVARGSNAPTGVVGANTSGTGPRGVLTDPRFGADFFGHLISLQNHLLAGDTAAIAATDRDQLGRDEDNLLLHVGDNAATQGRLETNLDVHKNRSQSLEGLVSREVDVDLAQTIVRLTQSQTAYQAALQSGSRLLSTSLLDYLR